MKHECGIVQDLLPLYQEGMTSEESNHLVQRHLAQCPVCQEHLERMRQPQPLPTNMSVVPLKRLKKRLWTGRVLAAVAAAAVVLAAATALFAYWNAPQYFAYAQDLMHVEQEADGSVLITFRADVTAYTCSSQRDEESGTMLYRLDAWTTQWDQQFSQRGLQRVFLSSRQGPFAVYFAQNNGQEDVLVYGQAPLQDAGMRTLPRLALGGYFFIAGVCLVLSAAGVAVFRKRDGVRVWLERSAILSAAYLAGHLCIKGLCMQSYCLQRDLSAVVLTGLLFGLAGLCVHGLCRRRKQKRKNPA